VKLDVKVIPKASRNAVKEEAGRLKVYVTAPPEKGKANAAVLELLSRYFGVKKQKVILLKGATSPHKTIEILL
jgi:uncharacterized protein (TIGR00251 family)